MDSYKQEQDAARTEYARRLQVEALEENADRDRQEIVEIVHLLQRFSVRWDDASLQRKLAVQGSRQWRAELNDAREEAAAAREEAAAAREEAAAAREEAAAARGEGRAAGRHELRGELVELRAQVEAQAAEAAADRAEVKRLRKANDELAQELGKLRAETAGA